MDFKDSFTELSKQISPARLMAVSKTRPFEDILSAYQAGYRLFGENHVQEITEKFTSWHPEDVEVHMIGHLQSNKVAKAVAVVDMIQSVDSLSLLEKINSACEKIGKVMPVLLEMNTSGEEAKTGFDSEEELEECLVASFEMKNVEVCGFMTVGPVDCSPEEKEVLTRRSFRLLRQTRDNLLNRHQGTELKVLSMGMSGDWKIALEEGSTLVRIGTAIFGERHYD